MEQISQIITLRRTTTVPLDPLGLRGSSYIQKSIKIIHGAAKHGRLAGRISVFIGCNHVRRAVLQTRKDHHRKTLPILFFRTYYDRA